MVKLTKLYSDYFQKSYTFLYPLLELAQTTKPLQTYLSSNDIDVDDYFLICRWDKNDSHLFNLHSNKYLLFHTQDDNYFFSVFSFRTLRNDYYNFIQGNYSKMSNASKEKIVKYYNKNMLEKEYIKSFLYPSQYYSIYSILYNISENILKQNTELCEKYNVQHEHIKHDIFNIVKKREPRRTLSEEE